MRDKIELRDCERKISAPSRTRLRATILAGAIVTVLVAWASVGVGPGAAIDTGTLQPRQTAMMDANDAVVAALQVMTEMKIMPARADGPGGSFFVGTGDGGNGFYVP